MPDLESYKQEILDKLQEAGAKGLNKTQLGIRSKAAIQAIETLEAERKVANLETGKKYLYVLKEYDIPLEMAHERIEATILSYDGRLCTKTKILNDSKVRCPGRVRKEFENAIEWLVKENKLLKLRHKGYFVFLHVSSLQSLLPSFPTETEEIQASPELRRDRVLEAYHQVCQRIGFSNVEIYDLQQALGIPMKQMKEFLLEESRQGRAVLSLGDWSLSSEETRSGVIYMGGKSYLLVRFKE